MAPAYHAICFLVAEKGPQDTALVQTMKNLLNATTNEVAQYRCEFGELAEAILKRERAAITKDPGVWTALRASLHL